MQSLRLHSFLGMPLSRGLQCVAWLELLGYSYVTVCMIYMSLVNASDTTSDEDYELLKNQSGLTDDEDLADEALAKKTMASIASSTIVIQEVLGFASTIILLVGHARRNSYLIDIWLLVHLIAIPSLLAFNVRSLVESLDESHYLSALYTFIIGGGTTFINIYFILIIYSYRTWLVDDLKEENSHIVQVQVLNSSNSSVNSLEILQISEADNDE